MLQKPGANFPICSVTRTKARRKPKRRKVLGFPKKYISLILINPVIILKSFSLLHKLDQIEVRWEMWN